MQKIIHYCWFGGKPLPKKTKKYIDSWKKFLPDYEIKEWNEKSFNVNITNFSKEAYRQKKWAFVSDVARFYALKEHGGIYFDTDVEIINNIDFLLNNKLWIGKEDNKYVCTAIIGVKEAKNKHIENIFNIYKKTKFNLDNIYSITSPQILTSYLKTIGLKEVNENQILENEVHVYKKEYFYPKTYMRNNETFTEKTCIIHHFDASWTSTEEKVAIFFVRNELNFLVKYVFKFSKFLRDLKK